MIRLASIGVALAATSSALAQETPAQPTATTSSEFRLDVNLDAWFPRLVGDVALVPGGPQVDVEDLDLHDSEVIFSGNGRVGWDRWFVNVSGFAFDTDGQTGTAATSADWWSISADVGFALWTPFDDRHFPWSDPSPRQDNIAGDGAQRLSLAVAPTLGITYDDIDLESTTLATGAANEIDGSWIGVRVGVALGVRLHTRDLVGFLDRIEIGTALSVGPTFGASGDADGVGSLWVIDAGARIFFTPNIGAHIGYRLVDGDFDEERIGLSSTADVGLQGLLAGLTIHF